MYIMSITHSGPAALNNFEQHVWKVMVMFELQVSMIAVAVKANNEASDNVLIFR